MSDPIPIPPIDVDLWHRLALAYCRGWDGHAHDNTKALAIFTQLSELGFAPSQRALGSMFLYGTHGLRQNKPLALEWLLKSAEQGHAEAFYWLGFMFEEDFEGVPKNLVLANRCFVTAAEKFGPSAALGDMEAQFRLGECHGFGKGIPKDQKTATEWFTKAGNQGHHYAAKHLVDLLLDAPYDATEPRIAEGREWLLKAASGGDVDSMVALGRSYQFGDFGLPLDLKTGFSWMWRAGQRGSSEAQLALGNYYHGGIGTEVDSGLACHHWQRAADQGCTAAQNCLAVSHELGRGTRVNLTKAFELYTKAAKAGNPTSQYNLGRLLDVGGDVGPGE
jgi:hypothetical protein